ncbi:hypothetical protein SNEBB_004283 [Seison nebaliae]|nr:hypothetical protein SNEBB_004283 [Seison nebaliae]
MDIGKHCEKCQTLDFLPINCQYCIKKFCKNCFAIHQESCGKYEDELSDEEKGKIENIYRDERCAEIDCKGKVYLTSDPCHDCSQLFCIKHRHSGDHDCMKKSVEKIKNDKEKVMELQNKNIHSKIEKKIRENKKKNSLGIKVALMRLKSKAKSCFINSSGKITNNIDENIKIYLHCSLDIDGKMRETVDMFFPNYWTINHVRSKLCEEFKVDLNGFVLYTEDEIDLTTYGNRTIKEVVDKEKKIMNGSDIFLRQIILPQ